MARSPYWECPRCGNENNKPPELNNQGMYVGSGTIRCPKCNQSTSLAPVMNGAYDVVDSPGATVARRSPLPSNLISNIVILAVCSLIILPVFAFAIYRAFVPPAQVRPLPVLPAPTAPEVKNLPRKLQSQP